MTNTQIKTLETLKRSSNLVLPKTLNRITREGYLADSEGYLLSHETRILPNGKYAPDINNLNPRSLPLVHPNEWEVIARMFAWDDYVEMGKTFRLLTIDSSEVEIRDIRPHGTLDYGEYFGIVHKSAIVSDVEYTWINDGKPMKISKSAKENWPRMFVRSLGYSAIPVNQLRQ